MDDRSCRNCALAKWRLTSKGKIQRGNSGACSWDDAALIERIKAEAAAAWPSAPIPRGPHGNNGIWWSSPYLDCPQWRETESEVAR